jgi:hypothetical protein
MPYIATAIVLLSMLCLMNLILTLGIIRRMRAEANELGRHSRMPAELGPGSPIGEFAARTTDGETVSHVSLSGVVGFFSARCKPCQDLMPRFAEYAKGVSRDKVLAVIGGDDEQAVQFLTPVARVVVADLAGGPMAAAFGNTMTPTLYLVGDDHRVVATGERIEDLPGPSAHLT